MKFYFILFVIFVFSDYKCKFFCKIKEIKGLGGGVL